MMRVVLSVNCDCFFCRRVGVLQVVVNLDPTAPELGTIAFPMESMHFASGCKCDGVGPGNPGVTDLRINHYLGSIGDYMDRTSRYWDVCT